MLTTDNFNKFPEAAALLEAMIDERLGLSFFVQCDTQIARQENLMKLLGKAGCFQMFVGLESFDRQTLLTAHKGQNRPETYRDIVRLGREYGVSCHFSNILGFPQDTKRSVSQHLSLLRELAPTWASFYILCPIPGTEQYDDFLSEGLITEANLDRFDTTSLVWRHPTLSPKQLSSLLFECYHKFFSLGHTLFNVGQLHSRRQQSMSSSATSIAMSMFIRYCAFRKVHPMSGGVSLVHRDQANDYISLRQHTYGFKLAPLPKSLQTPVPEKAGVVQIEN